MNCVAFGSHLHVVHPITTFLKECQALVEKYRDSQDPNIKILIPFIPSIDPQKLDTILADVKASNFKTILNANGYDSTNINQSLFDSYPFLEKYIDLQSMLIFLYCILTYLMPSGEQDFRRILFLLQKAQRASLNIIHDFCFELVLSTILSTSNQNDLYEILLNYILNITSLAPTSFPLIITLFKLVSSSGNDTEMILLQHTIGHMLDCDFSCLHDVDLALLIEPLKDSIMDFNKNSLLVLGSATNKGKASKLIMNIIHGLYQKFIQFVKDNASNAFLIESSSDQIFHTDAPARTVKHNFQYFKKPPFVFVPPLLKELVIPKDFQKIISEDVHRLTIFIADFLSHSSDDVIFDFLAQFSVYLEQREHFFEMCSVFITVAYQLTEPKIVSTVLEILCQTLLFSPHQTVFQPELFDQRINYLRDQVFNFLITTDPKQIAILVKSAQRDPFILNEHFLRVLLKFESFHPLIFAEEPIRTILAYSLLDLEISTREGLEAVRSSNFYFVNAILTKVDAVDSLLSSPLFAAAFLHFIFEPGLQDFVLSSFSKAMVIINCNKDCKYLLEIAAFFQNLISSCLKKLRDDRYKLLYEKSVNSIILGLRYNPGLVPYFACLLNNLLDYLKASPTFEIVIEILDFIQLISFSRAYWELTPRQYSLILSTVRQICGDEPDERIIDHLFAILENSSFVSARGSIMILCPSVLPLLFAISGKSKKNLELISTFLDLCRFSNANCVAFHDGFIDHIIIQYLSKNENQCYVTFRDKTIELRFNRKKAVPLMLELLEKIILAKTNFSIAYSLMNLLAVTQSNDIYNFVSKLLLNGTSEKAKIANIPLDSSEPSIEVTGVDWTSLKNQFTIDFNLCMDEVITRRFRQNYILLEVTDKTNRFTLTVKNSAISANYDTKISTSTTFLFRNIYQTEWGHFTIIAAPCKDKLKFYNFLNKERMSDSTIDPLEFNGPVTIKIGGSDFNCGSMKHPCYGKMNGLKFFPFRINDDEVNLLAYSPFCFNKKALFTTNKIKSEMIKTIKFGDNIEMHLLPTFHRVMHILDFFSEPSLFEKMIGIERFEIALDLILLTFSKHPEVQPYFDLVDRLSYIASKDLKYSTYISLYRILSVIVDPKLKTKWFEKLILNFDVWSKSEQFFNIVHHWTNNFNSNATFFQAKNYFANLLSQFMKTYGESAEKKKANTIQQFYRFMIKLSKFNFNKESFDVLISCILTCNIQSNLWDLTKILLAVSNTEVAISNMNEEKLSYLYRLFKCQNPQLLASSAFCVHNLSARIPNFSMLSISYFVIDNPRLPILVDILAKKLDKYPRLLSLVTILSIHTGKPEVTIKFIEACMQTTNNTNKKTTIYSVMEEEFWYVWPILLILNASEKGCDVMSKFIANCLTRSNNGSDQIDKAFAMMFRMSFFTPRYDMIVRVLHHIHHYYTTNGLKMPDSVVEYCFIFFFLHIPQTLHSIPLLELVDVAPYPVRVHPRKSSVSYGKYNIFELESLMLVDFLKFDLQCRVSLDDDGNLLDKFYYDIYQNLKAPKNPLFDKKLMVYFINRESLDPQVQFTMAQNLSNTLDGLKSRVIDDIGQTLVKIQKGLLVLLKTSRDMQNIMQKLDPKEFEQVYKTNESNDKDASKYDIAQDKTKTLVRANITCASYCPFRLRKMKADKRAREPIPKLPGTPLHVFKCVLVRQEKRNVYNLSLYSDKFVFQGTTKYKIIPFDTILFLFGRKVGSANNGYELYLYNSKSYLFFLQNNDFQQATVLLKTMHFVKAEAVFFLGDVINIQDITKEWETGNLSTFDYLMKLNIFSGRSFKSLLIYPVMPPVISDFNNLKSNPNPIALKVPTTPPMPVQNLKDNFIGLLSIAPEFYFDPMIVKQVLPTWAKSKFEFVYLARKKLETSEISWFIDQIFGVGSKGSDSSSVKLFTRAHPKRTEPQFEQYKSHVFETGRNVISVLTYLSAGQLTLWIVFENRSICNAVIEEEGKMNLKYFGKLDCDDPIFSYSTHHIFAYSRRTASLNFFESPTQINNIPLYTEMPLFAALDDTVIFTRDECLLCKMNIDGSNYSKITYTESKVTAMAASNIFKIVVFSTMDGNVHFHDLMTCREIARGNCGYQVHQIVITMNWGFVVALSEDALFVFSVNGESITTFKYPFVIDKIFGFSVKAGFDFISFATNEYQVGYFEAMYPENWINIKKFDSHVERVSYDSLHRTFVIVEESGHIVLVPQDISISI